MEKFPKRGQSCHSDKLQKFLAIKQGFCTNWRRPILPLFSAICAVAYSSWLIVSYTLSNNSCVRIGLLVAAALFVCIAIMDISLLYVKTLIISWVSIFMGVVAILLSSTLWMFAVLHIELTLDGTIDAEQVGLICAGFGIGILNATIHTLYFTLDTHKRQSRRKMQLMGIDDLPALSITSTAAPSPQSRLGSMNRLGFSHVNASKIWKAVQQMGLENWTPRTGAVVEGSSTLQNGLNENCGMTFDSWEASSTFGPENIWGPCSDAADQRSSITPMDELPGGFYPSPGRLAPSKINQ